ncbi:hypothetical protein [Brevundimonas sp.]|uniref:hypothetical protein n=1 Tax=Brevundimonas sp. TaxID=1871086 RepID=UPI0028AC570F|nr:hypothetical protein [Brevundimonas sp.]
MSIAIMTAVWKLDMAPSDKMVLLALADAANDDGVTWIAVKHRKEGDQRLDLLTKCSLSERAVQGALKRLVDAGHLSRRDVPGKGVIWTVTPAASAPPQHLRPAGNDANPRSICGETVNNPQPSEANASSGQRAKARATRRCPSSWAPSPADVQVAESLGFTSGEIERELATIRDTEFGTPRSDWSATFRNWFRREAKHRKPRNVRPDRHAAQHDHLSAVARAMAAACDRAEGEPSRNRPVPSPESGGRFLPAAA